MAGQPIELRPNWFASVMGTGIIANAAATLPILGSSLQRFALIIWVIAGALLVGLIVAVTVQWIRHPHINRRHIRDPVMAQF